MEKKSLNRRPLAPRHRNADGQEAKADAGTALFAADGTAVFAADKSGVFSE